MYTRTLLKWQRKSPHSSNNFDLILSNPEAVDVEGLSELLNSIVEVRHRGLTLNGAATAVFRDWLAHPSTPLKTSGYVSLSNWFLTDGGDRHSELASRCERFWDAIFLCRPLSRLSSSLRAQNHKMLPEEFERFWPRLLAAQNSDSASAESIEHPPQVSSSAPSREVNETILCPLRAAFVKAGLRCEVEGSPQALAEFLRIVSAWAETTEATGTGLPIPVL